MAARQTSCRQQTAPPPPRCSKDVTAHPHRPGARPGRPCQVPARSGQPLSGRSIECVSARVIRRARTFMVKVKAHRGEPLNEKADIQAENARQLSSECQQWTTRTQRMTYEWNDSDGVQHVTAWSKAVRNEILRGGAEHQRQKALDRAWTN